MPLGSEEIGIIRTIFDGYDIECEGLIHINQFPSLLNKLNKSQEDIITSIEHASRIADDNNGRISFDDVINVLNLSDNSKHVPDGEGPDPKVLQFLSILEEYRIKCEEEGNYLEASRAHKQLGILRKQEEKRQQKVIQARHISERQDVQLAHNMQFSEFNKQWDRYLQEYDQMAQMYIQQMTERHALVLLEFQKQLRDELAGKPPKWSRTLLDQRRKQHINARNKNYAMAQKLKKMSDISEEKERKAMEEQQAIAFARREAKFRMQQQTELQALLKRIEARRKEHIKQRELDTKRLLQRNRNVQAVLENKQAAEQQKLFSEIKKVLYSNEVLKSGMSDSMKKKTQQSQSAGNLMSSTQPLSQSHKAAGSPNRGATNIYATVGGGMPPGIASYPNLPASQYNNISEDSDNDAAHAGIGENAAAFNDFDDGERPNFSNLIYNQHNNGGPSTYGEESTSLGEYV
jgi:hypothetical protein